MKRIAIVGASSEVATDLIDVLVERGFDLAGLRVLADETLAGEGIEAAGYDVRVEPAVPGSLGGGVDVGLFLGDGALARVLVPEARDAGAIVLDATPFSRESGAPVVLPEVNPESLQSPGGRRVLALPGPHAVGLAVALAPLHEVATVKRVVTTVFESASLRGREAMDELSQQSVKLMQGRGFDRDQFSEQLAFNVRPQAAALEGAGWSVDEQRIAREIGALFGDPPPEVVATVVRVPVFAGAAQSVYVELAEPLDLEEARRLLREGRGILVAEPFVGEDPDREGDGGYEDDPDGDGDPLQELLHDEGPGPVEVSGSEAVHVARLRGDGRNPRALAFWIAFDELRKGTSLSLVATLEIALRDLR